MSSGVLIKGMQGGGIPGNLFNLWTDDFSSGTVTIRQNYYHVLHAPVSAECTNSYTSPGANGGFVFQGAGSASVSFAHWIPFALPGAHNKSQFAEANIWENGAGTYRGGLGLLITGDHRVSAGTNSGYIYLYAVDSGATVIQKVINNVATNILAGIAVPADGSKVAFTAEIQVGAVVLNVYDDEVLIGTVTDNTGTRVTTGLPSMFTRNCPVATSMEYGNLRMGVLSKLGY